MSVRIVRATPSDAEALISIQRAAFTSEAERYDAFDMPPMTETAEDLRSEMRGCLVLKAVAEDGTPLGSVRGRVGDDDVVEVGRLAVRPDAQDGGIGRGLLSAVEEAFPEAREFELFTGGASEKAQYLYRSLGYREVSRKVVAHGRIELVVMRKRPERRPHRAE